MFSASSTRGLLIGVGNVGDGLKSMSSADTFLSRDAGLNWIQISKGPSIYQFGNHGSILILVERNKKSHTILYSLNEGKTWCSLWIIDKREVDLKIRDVITESSSTKRSFLLIGTLLKDTLSSVIEEPIVILLDFSSLYSKKCEMPKDFEAWKLSDRMNSHACHMGHNVSLRIIFVSLLIQRLNIYEVYVCVSLSLNCIHNYVIYLTCFLCVFLR